MSGRVLVTGVTGFIGGMLAARLSADGYSVRCLVRSAAGGRAQALEQAGLELHVGDVLRPETLRGAGRGIDAAYYLIHSMGRGNPKDFAPRERAAAASFARMARDEGIERVIYLGGLGDRPHSEHLRSRHETALLLRQHGPPLTYFRVRDGGRPAERVLPHAAIPGPAAAGDDRAGLACRTRPSRSPSPTP